MEINYPKYEFGFVTVPADPAQMVPGLNKIGEDGWEPWAVMHSDMIEVEGKSVPVFMLGVKRVKRLIQLAN